MTATSYTIKPDLHLVTQITASGAKPQVVHEPSPTNHVVVIDCSGSMYNDLPKIRSQLKKKLPKLLAEGDTLSMIWFSGHGDAGIILEAEPVATLTDLQTVYTAIDRWLKPMGMTGFKLPLEVATALCGRLSKRFTGGSVNSLFFMSDGCDNQSNRADVIKACAAAAGGFASATFVEYGYYADRPLLAKMAETAGGQLIFAEAFNRYEPMFEGAMQKRPMSAKRVAVQIQGDPVLGLVWEINNDGDLVTYEVQGGKVRVPETTLELHYLSSSSVGDTGDLARLATMVYALPDNANPKALSPAYAALSLFSIRMKPDIVYPILKALGDVAFIKHFATCFGKQKYSEFMQAAHTAVMVPQARFFDGYDPNAVPKDDAFTILDLLDLLAADENNRVLLDNPSFKYSRIGRGRVDANDSFTDEEAARIIEISEEIKHLGMMRSKPSRVKELQAEMDALLATKATALKFEADDAPDGYPVLSLTYNEERPNVSILVRKEGTVDLSSALVGAPFADKLPAKFKTFIWRNYAIIKDGLVNVEQLPARVTSETFKKLIDAGAISPTPNHVKDNDHYYVVLDLKPLAVINRKMVNEVSAQELFAAETALTELRAQQKVFNAYLKELAPEKKAPTFEALYGLEAATWLKEQGFTEHSGFAPKLVQAPSTDVYMGKQLDVSIKGQTLPSVADVKKRLADKKKLTGAPLYMSEAIIGVESFFAKTKKDSLRLSWLEGMVKATKAEVRAMLAAKAKTVYTVIVGQTWFKEFKSLDENTMKITFGDQAGVEAKVEMKEIEIKI